MKVFEFHFNPKLKPDLIFDSFCYEPENIYERRVGSLYLVGLLKNALPKNSKILENLAGVIKKEFYRPKMISSEKALKESLKSANDFLEVLAKKGDVSWLGNLSFSVICLKDFKWNFSKVGEIKIFLLRGGKLIDVEKKLRLEEIEPYPLRVFGSAVSGKLALGDTIFVLTKEVFDFFERENLFFELAKIGQFNERILKDFFEKKKEEVLKISGICLVISLIKEVLPKKRELILKKISPTEIKFREIFSPIVKFFRKVKLPPIKIPPLKPELKFPQLPKFRFNKKLITILALILVLALGFFFSSIEEKRRLKEYEKILVNVEEKFEEAESFLILKDQRLNRKANDLLIESLDEISPLVSEKLPRDFKNKVILLNEKILKKLYEINKFEVVEPELVFEFEAREFLPQKMIFDKENLYFFSPYAKKILKLEKGKEKKILEFEREINFASNLNSEILFFSKPDQLLILKGEEILKFSLKPYPDFDASDFSVFNKNLYFLDKKAGRIIKYNWLGGFNWSEPKIWIENEKIKGARAMAIDGDIWVLKENKILRLYVGKIQKEFDLKIFPEKKDFSKIFTSPLLPYLYILEPIEKRIVVLKKDGQILKQLKSEKFNNLLDFSVSKDGKTIWLLNGLKLFKIAL